MMNFSPKTKRVEPKMRISQEFQRKKRRKRKIKKARETKKKREQIENRRKTKRNEETKDCVPLRPSPSFLHPPISLLHLLLLPPPSPPMKKPSTCTPTTIRSTHITEACKLRRNQREEGGF